MKHLYSRMLFAFVLACMFAMPLKINAQDPNFHIYLCFGQSNMEGNAEIEAIDKKSPGKRFRMLSCVDMPSLNRTKGNWYVATPPLCRQGTGLTPADYFGRTLIEKLPDSITVGVVHVAVGGAPIELFDEDAISEPGYWDGQEGWYINYCKEYGMNPFRRLIDMAKIAQKKGVIKGILFHQGCSNNSQQDWVMKVKKIYTNICDELGLDPQETPILAGELVQQSEGGYCWGHNSVIAKLPYSIPNAHVISSAGCPCKGDGLHFTAEGYRIIGARYAEKMYELLTNPKEHVDQPAAPDCFPLESSYFLNPSIYGEGKYMSKNGWAILNLPQNGFGGWDYDQPLDLSEYKYLVVKLAKASAGAVFKIFDRKNYLDKDHFEFKLVPEKEFKIDLQNMNTLDGGKLDPSHIRMMGFTLPAANSVYVTDIFVSNDGETPASVNAISPAKTPVALYSVNGYRLGHATKGINIVKYSDGSTKKVFNK